VKANEVVNAQFNPLSNNVDIWPLLQAATVAFTKSEDGQALFPPHLAKAGDLLEFLSLVQAVWMEQYCTTS
jgi:hypothetical protein